MKSAKKVRVPINKKITPKRKKMRSKPRKQSKKRKHRGGVIGKINNQIIALGKKGLNEACEYLIGNFKIDDTDTDLKPASQCDPMYTCGSEKKCVPRKTIEQLSNNTPKVNNFAPKHSLDYHDCPLTPVYHKLRPGATPFAQPTCTRVPLHTRDRSITKYFNPRVIDI